MKREDTLALHVTRSVSSLMTNRTEDRTGVRIRKVTSQHGKILGRVGTESLDPRPQLTPRDQPRANSLLNDNYCVTKLHTRLLAGSTPQTIDSCTFLNVKPLVVPNVHAAPGHSQKKEISPGAAVCFFNKLCIKICQRCFWCHSIVLCPTCNKCQKCCVKTACRGKTSKLLANLAGPGCRSESGSNPPRGLHPPLSDPAKTHKISHSHKLLCQSSQEQLPVRGIASAYRQKCCRTGVQPSLVGVLQPTLFSPKTQQQVEADFGPKQSESISQGGEIQNGDAGNYQDLPPTRGMGYLDRFQGCLLPHTNTGTVQEISEISCPGADIPIQSTAFWSVNSTLGVHCDNERGETDGDPPGYKNPPVPRRLVGEGQIPANLSPTYPNPGQNVPGPRLAGKFREIRAGTQTGLRLCRLPVRPQVRPGQTDSGPVAKPSGQDKSTFVATGLSGPAVHVPDRSSNSHRKAGSLHMRPIQWHLKNNWRVPESLEKIIPLPRSLHPHLQLWLEEDNVLQGQPLHPVKHALQIFTDASKEGWGAHLNEFTARGSWSVPESKLHINYLELKAVFLALKEFQDLCVDKIVLVATDNTTVVAYINKEGGMRSGPLCALLWRILTWCSQRQVTLKARHIPGHLNVIADKLSRLGQTIQTEWSLLPEVFQQICRQWHWPQIDLFATRFNHKLPQFVSPVPDSLAVAVDALTLPWDDLDAYAFPPTAILGKVVEKLLDSPCKRLILIGLGWPNMP